MLAIVISVALASSPGFSFRRLQASANSFLEPVRNDVADIKLELASQQEDLNDVAEAKQILASKTSAHLANEIADMFKSVDKDKSGSVTMEELTVSPSVRTFKRAWKDYKEQFPMTKASWLRFWIREFDGSDVDIEFKTLDLDGNGFLSPDEFAKAQEVQSFKEMDADQDGRIDFGEWHFADDASRVMQDSAEFEEAAEAREIYAREDFSEDEEDDYDEEEKEEEEEEKEKKKEREAFKGMMNQLALVQKGEPKSWNDRYGPKKWIWLLHYGIQNGVKSAKHQLGFDSAETISICLGGTKYEHALFGGTCVHHCPHDYPSPGGEFCFKQNCDSGCTGFGGHKCLCTKKGWWGMPTMTVKSLGSTQMGKTHSPFACTRSKDIVRPVAEGKAGEFDVFFLGDPQFGYGPGHTIETNLKVIRALNELIRASKKYGGTILTGDLTNTGDKIEFDELVRIWGNISDDDEHTFKHTVWPLLGNHDVENYALDKHYTHGEVGFTIYHANGAVEHMARFMQTMITGCNHGNDHRPMWRNFQAGLVDHYESGSLAYAWSQENVRFININNYPTYNASACQLTKSNEGCNDLSISTIRQNSLSFLASDLKTACDKKQMAVLSFHDFGDKFCRWRSSRHFNDAAALKRVHNECNEFLEVIRGTCVVGIFVGHIHKSVGVYRDNLRGPWNSHKAVLNQWGQSIYVFRTGSPKTSQFLRATFNREDQPCIVHVEAYSGSSKMSGSRKQVDIGPGRKLCAR